MIRFAWGRESAIRNPQSAIRNWLMPFTAIHSEGGLIPEDLIERIAREELALGQKPSDFGLPAGRRLSHEISRAWSESQHYWQIFRDRVAELEQEETGTSLTRDRWMKRLLDDVLGYQLEAQRQAAVIEGRSYPISHRASPTENAPPVHIDGVRVDLDQRPGHRRLSPQALVQDFLNRSEPHLWGAVTNGYLFRLLRDSSRASRPTYLEFDLRTIFDGNLFSEFTAFYRLAHRTRLPLPAADPHQCWLEQYFHQGIDEGGRVRDRLRDGVEQALKILGTAFLRHPGNNALRETLEARGSEGPGELRRSLLLLVYRLLFLMVAEERRLIVAEGEQKDRWTAIYQNSYSVARLRGLAELVLDSGAHCDLWLGLRHAFDVLSDSPPPNSLPLSPLNGALFGAGALGMLEGALLYNHDLLRAVRHISQFEEGKARGVRRRINYAALDVEELGSVYESLLDYHPRIDHEAEGGPAFALDPGMERKSTGSYYTRPELVRELIQSALVPVIEDRLKNAATVPDKEKAILSITVCDPACGSGHFLLAAARRLGRELARARTGEEEPTPAEFRRAVRDVISHSIYGVDLNPLAVDLCQLALWIESHCPGKPLNFLENHIRCGNSLIGVLDPGLIAEGIPEEAFTAVTGDEKKIVTELKKRNRDQRRKRQRALPFDSAAAKKLGKFAQQAQAVLEMPEETPGDVRRKAHQYSSSRALAEFTHDLNSADLWTAAFFVPMTESTARHFPTHELFLRYFHDGVADNQALGMAGAERALSDFFHWHLEFPQVFANGGFDVMIGNPPWERIKLQEQEHWADDPHIAEAPNKAERSRRIEQYRRSSDPAKRQRIERFDRALHAAEAVSRFVRHSKRFPLTAKGDVNTYALFAELARHLVRETGRAGIIVPTGIATDDTCKEFFADLNEKRALTSLFDFENRFGIFPNVHRSYKFCLLTMGATAQPAEFAFFCTRTDHLRDEQRRFSLTPDDLALLNPNTRTCPVFRTRADFELTRKIYRRVPVLVNDATGDNPWGIEFSTMFHMANDSNLFETRSGRGLLPLYEAKLFHQYDHRWATYDDGEARDCTDEEKGDSGFSVTPRYWVSEQEVIDRASRVPPALVAAARIGEKLKSRREVSKVLCLWLASYLRSIGAADRERALLEKFVPPSLFGSVMSAFQDWLTQEAIVNQWQTRWPLGESDIRLFVKHEDILDYAEALIEQRCPKWFIAFRDIARATDERTAIFSVLSFVGVNHKAPLVHITRQIERSCCLLANVNSLPFDYVARQKIGGTSLGFFILKQLPVLPPESYSAKDVAFITRRILELTCTAREVSSFAKYFESDLHEWNPQRRSKARAELDAYFALLYGLTPDELRYVLDPADPYGPDFPGETFRVLKNNEEAKYGEYRTRRLVLAAYDELADTSRFTGERRESVLTMRKSSAAD